FRLAFGPRTRRRTRAGLDVTIATEGDIGRVEINGAGGAIAAEHQRARVVAKHRPREAAEMRERPRDPLAPIVAALIEKRFDKEATRVAEHGDQQKDPNAHARDRQALLAE